MKNSQTKETANRPFMAIEEAAEYLGISKATLYQYTHKKVLDYYKVNGKLIYFLKTDLDDFILGSRNLVKSQGMLEEEAKVLMKGAKL